jgi:hypothetical protein
MSRGRRSRRRSHSSPLGSFIAVLVVVAIIVKFIWWILGLTALIALFLLVRGFVRKERKRRAALARHNAAIAARADEQHQWVLQGDDHGIYGPERAKLMYPAARV